MLYSTRARTQHTIGIGSSGFFVTLLQIAIAGMGLTSVGQVFANAQTDRVFSEGFELPLAGFDDILLKTIATSDPSCPDTGRNEINTRPGVPVRFCYRLENRSNVTLDYQEISSSTYGLVFQGTMPIAPGESVVIPDPGSPRTFEHSAIDLVHWSASGAGRHGDENRVVYVNVAPDIELYRLVSSDAASCQAGIMPYSPEPTVSGYTALTVAPGDLITHCFRARNASVGILTTLTDSLLVDSLFGQLLDSDQSFINREVYTVAAQTTATATADFQAQWNASDGVQTVSSQAHSSLYVTTDPACDGIRQNTTYDYVFSFYGIQLLADIRLDFQVNASPVIAGEMMTLDAYGAITSLHPDGSFGPRRDTRVYLSIPAGVDLTRPLQVQASINDGVPISANLDASGRMLVLSTGRVAGAPAQINLHVVAYINSGQTQTLVWAAPKLQLDIEGDNGTYSTAEILPDPSGPPVLTTPLCVNP